MKIIEHGKYFGKFEIKCQICGCVFEVNSPDELYFSEPVYVNSNALTFVKVNCPECKAHIAFDENKIDDVTEM